MHWPGGGVDFDPSHGDWVRLLRRSGFVVEALHEVSAPPEGGNHPFYEIVSSEWATRWPAEDSGGRAPVTVPGHGFHVLAADCSSPVCWLRRRASASRTCDLTVPTEMSRAAAVSASVRSSK